MSKQQAVTALLLATSAGLLLASLGAAPPMVEGDTEVLVHDAAELLRCLREQQVGDCRQAGKFPPLQLAASSGLLLAGYEEARAARALARANLFLFAGLLIAAAWLMWTRARRWAAPAVLVLLASPLLFYARRSFGELPAALLTALLAAALLQGRLGWVVGFGFLVGLSKETALPFTVAMGAFAVAARQAQQPLGVRAQLHADRWLLAATGVGAVLGAAGCAALNLMRFGSPLNWHYAVEEAAWVPPPSAQLNHFAGLWLAPTGGLALYWPLLALTWVGLAIAVVRARLPRWPLLAGLGLLFALTAGLARWWTPFGWWAWGPRLMLPWVPAWTLMLLWAYAPALDARLSRRPLAWSALGLFSALSVLPTLVSMYVPGRAAREFESADFARCLDPRQLPMAEYSACFVDFMWRHHSLYTGTFAQLGDARIALWCACFAMGLGGVCWLGWREAARGAT